MPLAGQITNVSGACDSIVAKGTYSYCIMCTHTHIYLVLFFSICFEHIRYASLKVIKTTQHKSKHIQKYEYKFQINSTLVGQIERFTGLSGHSFHFYADLLRLFYPVSVFKFERVSSIRSRPLYQRERGTEIESECIFLVF